MRTRNNTVIITGADLSPTHEIEVVVQAVSADGRLQSPDDSPRNVIKLKGKETTPSQPAGLTALGGIAKISLFWDVQTDKDFDVMEVYALATDNLALAVKIAETKTTTFTDNIGYTGQTRYYWLRARNTSGKTSPFYPETNGVTATTIGIAATDIDDFAVTATKTFSNTVVLTGDSWGNNTPTPGRILWNQHHLVYNGAYYRVATGSTALKYVYWDMGNTGGAGTVANPYLTTYTASNVYSHAANRFMVATNESGVAQLVWNSSANMIIGSAFILDLAVLDAKIDTLTVAKLTAGTITSKIITLATAGAGDCYIASGKTDFTNVQTGFILGVDDSDGDKPKFYIGSSTKYLNWDGTSLTIRGTLNADDITAGSITARPLYTAASGSRVEMLSDAVTGLAIYDDASALVFKAFISGADVGDVVIGNYAGNNGMKWDKSAGTFNVKGAVTVGGTITGAAVQTAASGQRIVLSQSDNTLRFHTATETDVIIIDDNLISGRPGMQISSTDGASVKCINETTSRNIMIYDDGIYGGDGAGNGIDLAISGKYLILSGAFVLNVSGYINTSNVYKVSGTQVVSTRVIDARCDDAINSGDATTDGVIDSLRDAMIAHGLIAAS